MIYLGQKIGICEGNVMKYLYLHGLGQNADSWNKVTSATEVSENSACLDLAEMVKGKVATYSALYSAFSEMCNAENEDIILCGLSLGSVLALNYAIDYPQKVKALVLIAAQYKMPARLLKLQKYAVSFYAAVNVSTNWIWKTRFYKFV